jgi:ribosomal protein S18 acetylase RimI-like enzyme
VVATLVESHLDYVWEAWALPGPDRREQLTELVRVDLELLSIPYRDVWMHDDAAAVAVWIRPRAAPPNPDAAAEVARVARLRLGPRLAVIESVEAALAAHRPTEPHWFLATMGTRPDQRRRGLGTAVLRPVLDELDRVLEPACLETSSVANVAFYSRLGFAVVAHLDDLPADAPETWVMWREPRTNRSPAYAGGSAARVPSLKPRVASSSLKHSAEMMKLSLVVVRVNPIVSFGNTGELRLAMPAKVPWRGSLKLIGTKVKPSLTFVVPPTVSSDRFQLMVDLSLRRLMLSQ